MFPPKRFAHGNVAPHQRGQQNKTEQRYELHLQFRKSVGEVLWYKFEAIKFRVAPDTFYTPDFMVMLADLTMEVHEVKGHWVTAARIKIKVAADLYPFRFIAVTEKPKKDGGGYNIEEF